MPPNERIGVDVYKRGIEFYVAFLATLDNCTTAGPIAPLPAFTDQENQHDPTES